MNLYIILFIILFLIILIIIYIDGIRYITINDRNLSSLELEYKSKKRLDDVIITLTTTPKRISKIKPVINSLLDQSVSVKEIRINVPYISCKGAYYKIPKWLKNMKSVKIYRQIKDWGPATKLIPTLLDEKNRNKKIIVVDDDVIYGYYTIETLYESYQKYNLDYGGNQLNRKTAITMYGDAIMKDSKKDTDNRLYTRITNYMTGENYTDLLRGHSAYLVTRDMFPPTFYETSHFFQKSIFSVNTENYTVTPEECFYVDDNYFSALLKKNNVKILMVGLTYKSIPLPEIITSQLNPLHGNENHNGKNERIVNKFFS